LEGEINISNTRITAGTRDLYCHSNAANKYLNIYYSYVVCDEFNILQLYILDE